MKISIDFLKYQTNLLFGKQKNKRYIFCQIRKKYLIFQSEEVVRQLTLLYLQKEKNYSKNSIHVERGIRVNSLFKRCDIIIYDQVVNPYLLIECKAPEVKITQSAFDQIARYNLALQVTYLVVTNGVDTFCCKMDYNNQSYYFLEAIPAAPAINKKSSKKN